MVILGSTTTISMIEMVVTAMLLMEPWTKKYLTAAETSTEEA
jgi:hypothetical protein